MLYQSFDAFINPISTWEVLPFMEECYKCPLMDESLFLIFYYVVSYKIFIDKDNDNSFHPLQSKNLWKFQTFLFILFEFYEFDSTFDEICILILKLCWTILRTVLYCKAYYVRYLSATETIRCHGQYLLQYAYNKQLSQWFICWCVS